MESRALQKVAAVLDDCREQLINGLAEEGRNIVLIVIIRQKGALPLDALDPSLLLFAEVRGNVRIHPGPGQN